MITTVVVALDAALGASPVPVQEPKLYPLAIVAAMLAVWPDKYTAPPAFSFALTALMPIEGLSVRV